MKWKKMAGLLVIVSAVVFSGEVTRAVAQDESRARTEQGDRGPDYTSNKNYQLGDRDGQDDYKHKRDHSKKRHFKNDDDQKAYESGYQHGHQGNQGNEGDTRK